MFVSDNSSAPTPARLTLGARMRISPCFRTTADGRIALGSDWNRIFRELQRFDELAVQTRHAYARLTAVVPPPVLVETPSGGWQSDDTGTLNVRVDTWHSAWGRITPCPCCGSAGRVEVHNQYGLDFLQLCPVSTCDADDWSACIGRLLPRGDIMDAPPSAIAAGEFPCLRDPQSLLAMEPAAVSDLLAGLAATRIPFVCTLPNAEAYHRRVLTPDCIEDTDTCILSLRDGRTLLQLALPAVSGIAAHRQNPSCPLHIIGPGRSVLFTLTAIADQDAATDWRETIRQALPGLC